MTSDNTIVVLGAGSWGTALAVAMARADQSVVLWGRDKNKMMAMNRERRNRYYLPEIEFPLGIRAVSKLDDVLDDPCHYFLVVPTHAFRDTLRMLKQQSDSMPVSIHQSIIAWGTKGFEPETGKLMSEVAVDILGERQALVAVSGPSFAAEVAKDMPTALTSASADLTAAERVALWLRFGSLRVYTNDDLVGVQLGGAIKNVMAIAAGISDGLGFGANARAALITRGLAELNRLGRSLGGKATTYMGLTGVGDLVLTCTDDQSRNRRVGLGLGRGKSLPKILEEIGQEAEGIQAAAELNARREQLGVEMPITQQVYRVLYEALSPAVAVRELLEREPKTEVV